MFRKKKLCYAVATTIGASVIASNLSAEESDSVVLEEVLVTATKRAASTQDVPVAVQALGESSLDALNVGNFSDYVKFLPNVNFAGAGPGQNNVYIRGIATSQTTVMGSVVSGAEPLVAVYLDEAPATAVGRNLDVYISDMNRVEVLAGPQGTLFGSSSMAGTVRLITNKPDTSEIFGGVDLGTSSTKNGELNSNVEGYINIPLIEDKLAIRFSGYSVNNGGYIDNVAATRSLASNPAAPTGVPIQVDNNSEFVEDDFNDSYYRGARLGIKWESDNWSALVQTMQQTLGTDGVFDFEEDLGDLEVARFGDDSSEDEFTHTSWTLEGNISDALSLIYTGSYLDREVTQSIDYSGYANIGPFIPYYVCTYPAYDQCGSSVLVWDGYTKQERTNHEIRVSTDTESFIDFTGGFFFDDDEIINQGNWIYQGAFEVGGLVQRAPVAGSTASDPGLRDPGVVFFNDATRTQEQTAAFGEITFNLTESLSIIAGLRWYDLEQELVGSSNFGTRTVGATPGPNLDELLEPIDEDGTVSKFTVNYQPNLDLLLYATYSEGFRAGGFNRIPTYRRPYNADIDGPTAPASGFVTTTADDPNAESVVPATTSSDVIENYEFGWKWNPSDRFQFNGSIYRVDWSDIQISLFAADTIENGGSGQNLFYTINGGEAEVYGFEGDLIAGITDYFTLYAAVSYNKTELTEAPAIGADSLRPEGTELAVAPELQGNIRGRFNYTLGNYDAYSQLAVVYRDSAIASIAANEDFPMDAYTLVDFATGISQEEWTLEFFVENLTDKRAEYFVSNQDDILRTVTNRPRTIGLRASYDF